jgi:hypothetical protein
MGREGEGTWAVRGVRGEGEDGEKDGGEIGVWGEKRWWRRRNRTRLTLMVGVVLVGFGREGGWGAVRKWTKTQSCGAEGGRKGKGWLREMRGVGVGGEKGGGESWG